MKSTIYQRLNKFCAENDAFAANRDLGNVGRYYSVTNIDSLHRGRISVTHNTWVNKIRGDSGELAYELNRRQTCPRASKLSLHWRSLQPSLLAHSKKKKWLLSSQWSKSPYSKNSNTFAGRSSTRAPQNLFRSAFCVELIFSKQIWSLFCTRTIRGDLAC